MRLPGTNRLQSDSLFVSVLRRSAHNETGAALVETAFSLLLFLVLLMGVMKAGMAAYTYHYLSNAAHEATRYAIVRGASWGTSCDGSGSAGSGYGSSMCTASPEDIKEFVANRGFPGIYITTGDVCVEYFPSVPSSASSTCDDNSSPNDAGSIVQVTISYPYSLSLPGVNTYTYTIASTSQMVIAQ